MPGFTECADLPVSAPRMWLGIKDGPTLVPKIAPHVVKSMEHIEGVDGQVGAVRLIKLGEAVAPPGAYVKEKLLLLDHANFHAVTEEIEGGHLVEGFTKWSTGFKFTPVDDASCKVDAIAEYEGSNDEAVAKAKEGMIRLFQEVAAYIKESGAYA